MSAAALGLMLRFGLGPLRRNGRRDFVNERAVEMIIPKQMTRLQTATGTQLRVKAQSPCNPRRGKQTGACDVGVNPTPANSLCSSHVIATQNVACARRCQSQFHTQYQHSRNAALNSSQSQLPRRMADKYPTRR